MVTKGLFPCCVRCRIDLIGWDPIAWRLGGILGPQITSCQHAMKTFARFRINGLVFRPNGTTVTISFPQARRGVEHLFVARGAGIANIHPKARLGRVSGGGECISASVLGLMDLYRTVGNTPEIRQAGAISVLGYPVVCWEWRDFDKF